MNDEYRRPNLIQDEISSLEELIRENKRLVSLYPDDYALKLNLKSLMDREENLLIELKIAYERLQMETFDIVLEGDPVNGNSISLSFLGKIAFQFQELVTSITQSIIVGPTKRPIPQNIVDEARLNLIGTGSGSFRIILSTYQPALEESVSMRSLVSFNKLIDCGDDRERIKKQIEVLGKRATTKYKDLLYEIYKNKSNIKLYDKIRPREFQTKSISSYLAKKIYDVIVKEEDIPDQDFIYKGVIKGISLISYTFEFLIDESQEKIKGTFDDSLSSEVKSHFDQISIAHFRLATQWSEVTEEEKKVWKLLGFEGKLKEKDYFL